jgi:hypothetical protein
MVQPKEFKSIKTIKLALKMVETIASSARSFFVSFIHEICVESHNNGPKQIAQTATTTNFNESN